MHKLSKNALDMNSEVYYDQLTWLRGIAAFFVIVSHSLRATEVKYNDQETISNSFFVSLFDLGSFGVILFFVLSGTTLYISNANKVNSIGNIINFYIKRVFRIWPAFAISLVFYIIFGSIFSIWYTEPHGYWIEKQFLTSYSISDIMLYLSLTFNITGPGGLFNNVYWSLPVEFQYYLLFPIILISLKYVGYIGPIIIALILYIFPKLGILDFDRNTVFMLAYSFSGGILIGYFYNIYSFRMNAILGSSIAIIFIMLSSFVSNGYIPLPDFPILSSRWNWYIIFSIFLLYILYACYIDLILMF